GGAPAGLPPRAGAGACVRARRLGRGNGPRRFNQAALLSEVIADASGLPVAHAALKRVKATPQQVGLSQSERALNVQGAFRVLPPGKAAVAGRRLILVDDVVTTGATVDACARVLLRAGAARVDVLAFARVVAAVRAPI